MPQNEKHVIPLPRFRGEMGVGERGRLARCFRRLAENSVRLTFSPGEVCGDDESGGTPDSATRTVALP